MIVLSPVGAVAGRNVERVCSLRWRDYEIEPGCLGSQPPEDTLQKSMLINEATTIGKRMTREVWRAGTRTEKLRKNVLPRDL